MLGTYPIGGPNAAPSIPDLSPPGLGQSGQGEMPTQPLPQGMFAAQPQTHFFGQGGVGRGIAGAIGDYLLQRAGAQPIYSPAMQAQAEMRRQMMMKQMEALQPQRIGDSLVQMGQDGQYHSVYSAPSDDTPKPTEQQRNYEWLKGIDPQGAEEYRKNLVDPIHWIQVDDPATGGKNMVPVNHNGPLGMQAHGMGNPADAMPTVEEGWSYSPGPGGRANPTNWKPAGGASQPGSHTFP